MSNTQQLCPGRPHRFDTRAQVHVSYDKAQNLYYFCNKNPCPEALHVSILQASSFNYENQSHPVIPTRPEETEEEPDIPPTSSDIDNMSTSFGDILRQLAEQQAALQQQVMQLAQTLSSGTPKSDKSSIAKLEPFTGKAADVRSFLAFFMNWAGTQKDLTDDEKQITLVLSFMHG